MFEEMVHCLKCCGAKVDFSSYDEFVRLVSSYNNSDYYNEYSEKDFVKEYLQEALRMAIDDDEITDIKIYANILYRLFG